MSPEIIDSSRKIVEIISSTIQKDKSVINSDYGHAARSMSAILKAYQNSAEEEQKDVLRNTALKLVQQFGKKILKFEGLKQELKGVLTEEELESLD